MSRGEELAFFFPRWFERFEWSVDRSVDQVDQFRECNFHLCTSCSKTIYNYQVK
jgi:hypothetical protein